MPKAYVSTYAKYNSGSLKGEWLDLEDYADKGEFIEACRKLHKDEPDPELMFQDWEDVPSAFISEGYIDESFWDYLDYNDWHDGRAKKPSCTLRTSGVKPSFRTRSMVSSTRGKTWRKSCWSRPGN